MLFWAEEKVLIKNLIVIFNYRLKTRTAGESLGRKTMSRIERSNYAQQSGGDNKGDERLETMEERG